MFVCEGQEGNLHQKTHSLRRGVNTKNTQLNKPQAARATALHPDCKLQSPSYLVGASNESWRLMLT